MHRFLMQEVRMLVIAFLVGVAVGLCPGKKTFLGRPMDARDLPPSAKTFPISEHEKRFRLMKIPINQNTWQIVYGEDFQRILPQ